MAQWIEDETRGLREAPYIGIGLLACKQCGHSPRYHREDGYCLSCDIEPTASCYTPANLKAMAKLQADHVLTMISKQNAGWDWMYTPEETAFMARQVVRTCRRYWVEWLREAHRKLDELDARLEGVR